MIHSTNKSTKSVCDNDGQMDEQLYTGDNAEHPMLELAQASLNNYTDYQMDYVLVACEQVLHHFHPMNHHKHVPILNLNSTLIVPQTHLDLQPDEYHHHCTLHMNSIQVQKRITLTYVTHASLEWIGILANL